MLTQALVFLQYLEQPRCKAAEKEKFALKPKPKEEVDKLRDRCRRLLRDLDPGYAALADKVLARELTWVEWKREEQERTNRKEAAVWVVPERPRAASPEPRLAQPSTSAAAADSAKKAPAPEEEGEQLVPGIQMLLVLLLLLLLLLLLGDYRNHPSIRLTRSCRSQRGGSRCRLPRATKDPPGRPKSRSDVESNRRQHLGPRGTGEVDLPRLAPVSRAPPAVVEAVSVSRSISSRLVRRSAGTAAHFGRCRSKWPPSSRRTRWSPSSTYDGIRSSASGC